MRSHRVAILNKVAPAEKAFGEKTGYRYDDTLWSSYEFAKGTKALREGSLDAYDSVIFRMNFSGEVAKKITRESLVECDRIAALKIIIPKDLVNLYTELRDKYM